jgi:hypothetical protein
MRRAVFALTAVLVIIFLMQPIAQVTVVKGNFLYGPSIGIASPESYEVGRVYQETTVDVAIYIHQFFNSSEITDVFYSLDGTNNRTLSISNNHNIDYSATGTMENLTDGYHFLRAFTLDAQGKSMSISTTFLVNTTFSYPTLLLSPQNIKYSKNEVPLNYTIDREAKYVVYYSLDNSKNYTSLTSNTTLSYLSEGQHEVTIKAMNGFSIYSEKTVYFEISTTTIPEFSWLAILPLFLSLLFVAVKLRHRKTTKLNQ